MDFYNINLFEEITKNSLITKFQDSTLITSGNIEVYGDTLGKPGDILYDLKSIVELDINIVLDFGTFSVEIQNPKGIVVNKCIIGVKNASKVLWNWSDTEKMIYTDSEEGLKTWSTNEKHNFKTSLKNPAFLFSTW